MDGKESARLASFSRRTALLAGGTMLLFSAIAGRLYHLQVVNSEQYKLMAEDNRVNLRRLALARGRILDRFGVELATNRQNYRILLVQEQAKDAEAALDALGRLVHLDESRRKRVLRDLKRSKPFVPVTVAENLTWDEFARVNLNLPALSGVIPDVGETRDYPFGPELAHILGYVAAVSEDDLKAETEGDPLLELPGFRIGKSGIERAVDRELRGRAGALHVEVNAFGRVIREIGRIPGEPGKDVVLTLDMEVQRVAQEQLAGESGSAVVIDVHTGEIIACVSAPGFDPNAFNRGLSSAEWRAMTEDPYNPLLNKTLAGCYPPGSTYKPLVALAALEYGVVDPEFSVFCPGKYTLGGHDFHCWKRGGHGTVNMLTGMKHSCDVYFYEIARRIGIDRIEEISHKFGLGETFNFEVPGEKAGTVPGRAWKQRMRNEPWQQGETLITGIGQGYLLTTPLQLAVMTARIANGGRMVMPHLIRSVGETVRPVPEARDMGLNPQYVKTVLDTMDAVTNMAGGTAFGARIDNPAYQIAGKTGTAQVRRIRREERLTGVIRNEDLPWHLRDHALFVAYAPSSAPRYAISLIVEHGGSGSKAAAPRAREIMLTTLMRDPSRRPPVMPYAAARAAREG